MQLIIRCYFSVLCNHCVCGQWYLSIASEFRLFFVVHLYFQPSLLFFSCSRARSILVWLFTIAILQQCSAQTKHTQKHQNEEKEKERERDTHTERASEHMQEQKWRIKQLKSILFILFGYAFLLDVQQKRWNKRKKGIEKKFSSAQVERSTLRQICTTTAKHRWDFKSKNATFCTAKHGFVDWNFSKDSLASGSKWRRKKKKRTSFASFCTWC